MDTNRNFNVIEWSITIGEWTLWTMYIHTQIKWFSMRTWLFLLFVWPVFIHSLVHSCVLFFYEQKMKIITSIKMWAFCALIWFELNWKCVAVFNGIGQWERVFVLAHQMIFYFGFFALAVSLSSYLPNGFSNLRRERESESERETVNMCRTVAVRNSSSNGGGSNKLNEEMLSW